MDNKWKDDAVDGSGNVPSEPDTMEEDTCPVFENSTGAERDGFISSETKSYIQQLEHQIEELKSGAQLCVTLYQTVVNTQESIVSPIFPRHPLILHFFFFKFTGPLYFLGSGDECRG